MKFTCTIEINKPFEKVAEVFQNNDYRKEWQEGFVSCEHLLGTPGAKDAKSRIIFMAQKQEQELIETILKNDLPNEFSAFYEHKHMDNIMISRFIPIAENKTRYETEIEYTTFKGLIMKIMVFFMKGMFKKQMENHNLQFKTFVESL